MPRIIGSPSRIYTESGKISQDITDFSMDMSYNLLDTTDVESAEVKKTQGLRDSSASFNSFLESDKPNINDRNYAFQYVSGSAEPYPTMLFKGLLTGSVATSRGSDTNITRDVSIEQGSFEGFRSGKWVSVERTKSADSIVYRATKTIEEIWVSDGLDVVLSGSGRGSTNNVATVDTSSLSDGDTILIAFRLAE